jgi:basic amino acid/polyamine antiporter, APA family
MISSVFLAVCTYLFPITTGLATASDGYKMAEGSYPELADNLGFGVWLRYLLTVGALASNFGTYIAYLATASQSLHALALEGRLPFFMTLTLPKFGTPVVCILFYTLTTMMLVLLDFSVIVETESVMYCVHVLILFTAFVRLRFVAPDMKRPYRVPGSNIIAFIVAALPTAVALINIGVSHWLQWIIVGSTVAIIAIAYFGWKGIKRCRGIKDEPASPTEQGESTVAQNDVAI